MNMSLKRGWKRLALVACLLFPLLYLLLHFSVLSPLLLYFVFFLALFCLFLALACLQAPSERKRPAPAAPAMANIPDPRVAGPLAKYIPPQTLREILLMGATNFEIFVGAVLVALGEGYRLVEHCGKSGDEGIDLKLSNLYLRTVVVQCKLYAPDTHVGQPEIRDFLGSILHHRAVYGFFVTTSTFTPAARSFLNAHRDWIRPIDGHQLLAYIKQRPYEIAQALSSLSGEPR